MSLGGWAVLLTFTIMNIAPGRRSLERFRAVELKAVVCVCVFHVSRESLVTEGGLHRTPFQKQEGRGSSPGMSGRPRLPVQAAGSLPQCRSAQAFSSKHEPSVL